MSRNYCIITKKVLKNILYLKFDKHYTSKILHIYVLDLLSLAFIDVIILVKNIITIIILKNSYSIGFLISDVTNKKNSFIIISACT